MYETSNDPIFVDLRWAEEVTSVYSCTEFLQWQKDDLQSLKLNNYVTDLICVNKAVEVKFVRGETGNPQASRGHGICVPFDSICIRACYLVQQNFQVDTYYLEVQNIKIDLRKIWKASMEIKTDLNEYKQRRQPEGVIEGQRNLLDTKFCEKSVYTRLDYQT